MRNRLRKHPGTTAPGDPGGRAGHRNRSRNAILCFLISLFSLAHAWAQDGPNALNGAPGSAMPDTYSHTNNAGPDWISARMLPVADDEWEKSLRGAVGKPLVEPTVADQILDALRNADKEDCRSVGDLVRTSSNRGDLPSALRTSKYVFLATVTGLDTGFYFGFPGTLYRVVTDEVFKGPKASGIEYYFFLPVGKVQLGDTKICRQVSSYPELLPSLGDQVLLIADGIPSGDFVRIAGSSGLVVMKGDDRVSLPRPYLTAHGAWESGKEQFLSWIRTMEVAP